MNTRQVESILHEIGTDVHHDPPGWSLYVSDIYVLCILNETTNRVRLMAPVSETKGMSPELLSVCLEANFDRTLDARYCLCDETVWAVFLHPLSSLNTNLLHSGIEQVVSLTKNFGTTFAGGDLAFEADE